ncbi:hypothetical protein OCF62_11820 [Bacillus wiedmannii]|nr:hypothetical protein [Bacillus wiedmannii]MCU5515261.1 hypothetical protein [Bacillus wiedmannii]
MVCGNSKRGTACKPRKKLITAIMDTYNEDIITAWLAIGRAESTCILLQG